MEAGLHDYTLSTLSAKPQCTAITDLSGNYNLLPTENHNPFRNQRDVDCGGVTISKPLSCGLSEAIPVFLFDSPWLSWVGNYSKAN
jgi:hypothetical protein